MNASQSDGFKQQLTLPEYPRSAAYDPDWVIANMMGPNPLWLTEALTEVMALQPTNRVLDLGCGKALSSIFLAREFGVKIEAVDLWVEADNNQTRIEQAGLVGRIHPVHSDAMSLPFEDATFDAIVSVDAYHYFGTKPDALPAVLRVLKPAGLLGVVVPGLSHEIESWPPHLKAWWQDGFETFHTPAWWQRLWEQSGLVEIERADQIPGGHEQWLTWGRVVDNWAIAHGDDPYRDEVAMLEADHEGLLGFTRLIARKR